MCKALHVFFAILLLVSLAACNQPGQPTNSSLSKTDAVEPEYAKEPQDSGQDTVREITDTKEILGAPNQIILMQNGQEKEFTPQMPEYTSVLALLNGRFPEGMAEAACAFDWFNEGSTEINWQKMAQDFDYMRLDYKDVQKVKMNCFRDGYKDFAPEISYQHIIFPLTGDFTEMCIVGVRFLGPLDESSDILNQLLNA